ncbi:MAG: heavy-metal-associated domain-containing protein [Cohaesibacter sp.]|nr:heavy-metal-associated domain-containing protein [Cohaesibacter sp.]
MITLNVQEMACGGCVKSIREAIEAKDAAAKVDGNLEAAQITVETSLSAEDVRQTIEELGFPASL